MKKPIGRPRKIHGGGVTLSTVVPRDVAHEINLAAFNAGVSTCEYLRQILINHTKSPQA